MRLVAGAGIGAGHREQRDLLALEDVVGGLDLRTFRRHHAKFCFRQLVANLDGHRQFSMTVRMFLRAFCAERKRLHRRLMGVVIPGRCQRVGAVRRPMTGSASNPESRDPGSGPYAPSRNDGAWVTSWLCAPRN